MNKLSISINQVKFIIHNSSERFKGALYKWHKSCQIIIFLIKIIIRLYHLFMFIFNNYLARALIRKMLSTSRYEKYFFIFKNLSDNWHDNKGNNLFHYSAFHQKEDLFFIALKNGMNINQLDKKGRGSIHRLIEYAFVEKILVNEIQKKEHQPAISPSWINKLKNKIAQTFKSLTRWVHDKIELYWYDDDPKEKLAEQKKNNGYEFRINQNLLNLFLENHADVNLLIDYGSDPNFRPDTGVFSLNNIAGSPIELLIVLCRNHVLRARFEIWHDEDAQSIEEYNQTFSRLIEAGANINLIIDRSMLSEQVKNDVLRDATQETSEHIVSHYFMKYITMEKDCYSVLPLLAAKSLSFSLQDGSGETVLHTLFARINSRYHVITRPMVIQMFLAIYHNPSFDKKVLDIRNNSGLMPLELFKRDRAILAQDFKHMLLAEKLAEELSLNEDIEEEMSVVKI